MNRLLPRPLLAAALLGGAALSLCACGEGRSFMGAPMFQRAEQPCHDMSFPIYFDRGSDQLTEDARTLISMTGGRVKSCRVNSAEVVGLAAAVEPNTVNAADLSRRRADNVARALADAGLPAPKLDVESAGASGAVTPGGRPEPLRRRTEVILHLSPR